MGGGLSSIQGAVSTWTVVSGVTTGAVWAQWAHHRPHGPVRGLGRAPGRAEGLPIYALACEDGETLFCEGAHDGYAHLGGSPVHHRRIAWRGSRIEIRDRITGWGKHEVELRLHLHPDISFVPSGEGVLLGCNLMVMPLNGSLAVERGWYCSEFGRQKTCPVLYMRQTVSLPWEGGFVLERVRD